MKKKSFRFFFLIIFQWIVSVYLHSQQRNMWVESDIATYRQFINKEWDSLQQSANRYLKSGIDYYYLRIRLGIAYFEQNNYTKAIKHFKKAWKFSPADPTSIEYLYFSNLYLNRDFETKIWGNRLKPERKRQLAIQNRFIEGYSFDITYNYSLSKEISEISNNSVSGIQHLPKSLINTNISLKHIFLKRFKIIHAYTLMHKTSYYYLKEFASDKFYTDEIYQNQYFITAMVYPFNGFQLSGSYHQLWVSVPQDAGNRGNGRRNLSSFSILTDSSWSVSANQTFGPFSTGYTFTASGLNGYNQKQHMLNVDIFPTGNLNLYILSRFILFSENTNPVTRSLIAGETFGIQYAKNCWAEVNLLAGKIKNMSDYGSYIIYNDLNTIKLKTGVHFLFLLTSGKVLSLRANYLLAESNFIGSGSINNQINYSSLSITGGISWNF